METNQSTYITAVNIKSSKPSYHVTDLSVKNKSQITNNLNISPEKDTKLSLPKMETQKQIVKFLKYSSKRSDLLKTEFINFLLKDENFNWMDESEKFMREKILNNINIMNKNNLEIKKKKEEYEKIIMELNKEINNNFEASQKEEEDSYMKKKSDLESQIKDKKHEFGMLQNSYREEYKERYLIVQRQKNEVQNIKLNSKQFEKYNLLNKKISFESNQKENLLNDVKKYLEQSRKVFSEEIENKTQAYKELELEVQILKQSTESIEKGLNNVIDKRNKVCKFIEEQIDINNFIKNSIESVSNDYFLNKMRLLRNTEMSEMNLDYLIKRYQEMKNKRNQLKKDLFNTNKDITNLNQILHKLQKEFNEKKEENKKLIKSKSNNKYDEKEKINKKKELNLFKDKINNLKRKNKSQLILIISKTNFLIFCYKYLFQSANILYKSFESSRINFNFDLEQKDIFCNEIKNSKYFELINKDQKYFNKILTTNEKIFEEPKYFFLFGIKNILYYISAINLMVSNVLNLSCFNNEDFIDKFPLSQFNTGIFSFKENERNNDKKSVGDVVINKESNKVIITNFFSKDNTNTYINHLNQNSTILSIKKEIMGKNTDELIKMNKSNIKVDIDKKVKKNYPNRVYLNFINNENTSSKIKNSRYIRNHPFNTLLSLKKFFSPEEQNSLFIRSADINKKRLNDNDYYSRNYSRNKLSQRSFDNNLTYLKSPLYKKINYIKNKNINDAYLFKEYKYEIDNDDYQEDVPKKRVFGNLTKHVLKYSGEDPQKQLIFSRMMDIRNLELLSGSSINKSTSMNDITEEKVNENKFYEMYDKFKKKYFFNQKKAKEGITINNTYKSMKKIRKLYENTSINKKNSLPKNINLRKGMKFIRNNSDFFYGVKGSNANLKNKREKFVLPNISNRAKKHKNKTNNSKNIS